jgi:hypothetical protein
MGLTVVGHIASWYGIRVELRPRPGGGTVAEVTLPSGLFSTVPVDEPSPAVPLAEPAAFTAPAGESPVAPAALRIAGTTSSGLPRRRTADSAEPALVHAPADPMSGQPPHGLEHRDPGRVSASMAAYARGIGASRAGRGAPKPLLSVPDSAPNQKEDA